MTKNTEDDPTAAARYIMTERFLERAVVWLGIGAFVLAVIGVFYLTHPAGDLAAKMELLWRGMVIYGGLLGFVTVVWRGLIATRQADQQREQLDVLAGQMEQTARRDLADILREGSKMLDSSGRSATTTGAILLFEVAVANDKYMSPPAWHALKRFASTPMARIDPETAKIVDGLADAAKARMVVGEPKAHSAASSWNAGV